MTTRHFAVLALAMTTLCHAAVAQDQALPGSDSTLAEYRTDVVFRGPTLVVLIPLPSDSAIQLHTIEVELWRISTLKLLEATRAVAEPAGFQVVARDPRYASLRARGGGVYYAAPSNARTGYILVAPLKQSRLQIGYLDASDLEALLAAYANPMHPLAL